MEAQNIIEEIQKLKREIFGGKARNMPMGEHKSRIGGVGFEIRDIGKWERGDSFSSIDWRMSLASYPDTLYKLDKIETKEVPVAIVADCSPSVLLGFNSENDRLRLLIHLISTFSFTASYFHDPVVMAFAGIEGEVFVPSRHGHGHVVTTIYRLVELANEFHRDVRSGKKPSHDGLSLNESIQLMASRIKRQSTVAIISDFVDAITGKDSLDMGAVEYLSAKSKQNTVVIFLQDDDEFSWSRVSGTVMAHDIETGQKKEVKAGDYRSFLGKFHDEREVLRRKLSDIGVESLILSWENYFNKLSDFMMSRRAA